MIINFGLAGRRSVVSSILLPGDFMRTMLLVIPISLVGIVLILMIAPSARFMLDEVAWPFSILAACSLIAYGFWKSDGAVELRKSRLKGMLLYLLSEGPTTPRKLGVKLTEKAVDDSTRSLLYVVLFELEADGQIEFCDGKIQRPVPSDGPVDVHNGKNP